MLDQTVDASLPEHDMIWHVLIAYLAGCYLVGLYLTLRLYYRKQLRHVLSLCVARLRHAALRSVTHPAPPASTADDAESVTGMPERQIA